MSVETIYNGFGSKKALLREAMDVAVVGDTEPIPFAERPEFAALGEGTLRRAHRPRHRHRRRRSTSDRPASGRRSSRRPAPTRRSTSGASSMEANRRIDVRRSLELILGERIDDALVTMLWVLYSPETYRKLVVDGGLSRAEYEALLIDASRRLTGT